MTNPRITYDDAELTLRLYEIRREKKMRKSRDIVNTEFWPESYADVLEVAAWTHPHNAAFRQTSSYWEMVYGMARRGITDADYLLENNGEGLFLFAKIEPFLAEFRRDFGETTFQNAEWITQNSENGMKVLARIKARIPKLREMTQAKKEG